MHLRIIINFACRANLENFYINRICMSSTTSVLIVRANIKDLLKLFWTVVGV